jgi:hypothetical protein
MSANSFTSEIRFGYTPKIGRIDELFRIFSDLAEAGFPLPFSFDITLLSLIFSGIPSDFGKFRCFSSGCYLRPSMLLTFETSIES